MAEITINEVSASYTYNIGTASFATVAFPITSCWGPGYVVNTADEDSEYLEGVTWLKFPATPEGLESFVSTYRGPETNYRITKDYSYHMAMTLLTAGYDILTCRLSDGGTSEGSFVQEGATEDNPFTLYVKAKYPGSFGNTLEIHLKKSINSDIWNIITYVVDSSGIKTAVENLLFVFDIEKSTDSIMYVDELESNFLVLNTSGSLNGEYSNLKFAKDSVKLANGSDKATDAGASDALDAAVAYAKSRYGNDSINCEYIKTLTGLKATLTDSVKANCIKHREFCFTSAYKVFDLLKDKVSYNPNRVISPGWDDQDFEYLTGTTYTQDIVDISPLHKKLMEVAYFSRCATAYIDVPKSLLRRYVYNESTETNKQGYAQRLARYQPSATGVDVNVGLYSTHSALFAPWGQYTYVGTSRHNAASPSFQALMIQRAMILNQSVQYEWMLPTNRKHNVKLGKFQYDVPKKILDSWQTLEGVGVNAITNIPELGTSLWGNSTLYEVPPATYQALANLSTRLLVNAVEDVIYRCGLAITFQYNNEQAYSSFYAGVTPLLDQMKNVGAIDNYYVKMASDINALDNVNANTVVGKVILVVNGVVNDIVVDLIALPPGTDLNQYIS